MLISFKIFIFQLLIAAVRMIKPIRDNIVEI